MVCWSHVRGSSERKGPRRSGRCTVRLCTRADHVGRLVSESRVAGRHRRSPQSKILGRFADHPSYRGDTRRSLPPNLASLLAIRVCGEGVPSASCTRQPCVTAMHRPWPPYASLPHPYRTRAFPFANLQNCAWSAARDASWKLWLVRVRATTLPRCMVARWLSPANDRRGPFSFKVLAVHLLGAGLAQYAARVFHSPVLIPHPETSLFRGRLTGNTLYVRHTSDAGYVEGTLRQ